MKNLKDYIIVVPDIVPLALCEAVLAEYKNGNDWIAATIKNGKNLNVRNCEAIGISINNVIEKNKEPRQKLDQELFDCAANAIKEYRKHFVNCNIEQDSGYDLLRYEIGNFYTTHTDSFKDRPRAVSCSFALNDDYEGGKFAFF